MDDDVKSFADASSFVNAGIAKHRQSIMHNRNIPTKAHKTVNFASPPDQGSPKPVSQLSPGSKGTRRSTITHNKFDSSMLKKMSFVNLGMMVDSNIDYSHSRRKSVLAVKQLQDTEERLSQMIKRQRQSMMTEQKNQNKQNFSQFHKPNTNQKSKFGESFKNKTPELVKSMSGELKKRTPDIVLEESDDDEENYPKQGLNTYKIQLKDDKNKSDNTEKPGLLGRHHESNKLIKFETFD